MANYAERATPITYTSQYLRQNLLALVGLAFLLYMLLLALLDFNLFVQFTLNGIVVGGVYSILAIGFTLVFSTVWFFDLAYGVLPAVGAYVIFNFHPARIYQPNEYLAVGLSVVVAGSLWWVLNSWFSHLQRHVPRELLFAVWGLVSMATAAWLGVMLMQPDHLHQFMSPVIGGLVALTIVLIGNQLVSQELFGHLGGVSRKGAMLVVALVGAILGIYCGTLLWSTDDAKLPLSAGLGVIIAGIIGLALYRGLYFQLRRRARSPLIMIVASLGVLLFLQATISVIFTVQALPLPKPFGASPIEIFDSFIKPFQLFVAGLAVVLLVALILMLRKTNFGKAVRAIGDDEEVARTIGINTPRVIAGVFFIGGAIAGLAGVVIGFDLTTIQPRMGFFPLFKGWIAAVIGGTGNPYGALVGGFLLGLIENYGIWFIPSEWKDAIAFIVFILFLLFRPRGLLPRK